MGETVNGGLLTSHQECDNTILVAVHLVEHLLTETFQIVGPGKGCAIGRSQRGFFGRPLFSAQVNPIAGSATFFAL